MKASVANKAFPKIGKESVIQGQVFIVTNGGNNVKLALVSISAFLEKDLISQVNKIMEVEQDARNKAAIKVQDAQDAHDLANKRVVISRKNRADASDSALKSASSGRREEYEYVESVRKAAQDTYMTDQGDAVSASIELDKARSELEYLTSPRHFIENLRNPKATSKSDAEGNFELQLPAGTYALVAKGKRMAGSSTELYEWIVKVEVSKLNQKIMLSNDNFADTKCSECVSISSAR